MVIDGEATELPDDNEGGRSPEAPPAQADD